MRKLEGPDPAVRCQVGVEHDELGMLFGELEQRIAVGSGDVLVPHSRARRDPGLRLALTLLTDTFDRRQTQVRQTRPDAFDALRMRAGERLVVGRARMPAVGA